MILLLDIYPKETKSLILKDICNSLFTAALFTIANIWKQPKCSWTNEWIKKISHTHTHTKKCYSATKKNEILPLAIT